MRAAVRRTLVWSVWVSLLLLLVLAVGSSGDLSGTTGFLFALTQPLLVFAWATVLSLSWWASLGALVAAFVIVHRRGLAAPEASDGE